MLITGCILKETPKGVLRISVMSRHTENDGVTNDKRLVGAFDTHLAALAPSSKLVGAYYKNTITWTDFEKRYKEEMLVKEEDIKNLCMLANKQDVVILCIEESPEFCHRRLLAEICKSFDETVQIHIN